MNRLHTTTDRHQRQILVVLDAASEQHLLKAQPREQARKLTRRQGGTRRVEPPLAA